MTMRKLINTILSLAVVSLLPASALAQGTIAYFQPSTPILGLVGQQVDFDGNGQMEITFYDASYIPASFYATAASGVGTARILVVPNFGEGSHLAALPQDYQIGGPLNDSMLWAAPNAPNSYGSATVLGSYFPEDIPGSLVPVGSFYGTMAFVGVHFQVGSAWHYGWVRIRGGVAGPSEDGQLFYLNPPGWILDWAYETRPDTPILAGAVPEPSSLALLATGGVLWLCARRGLQRRNSGNE